MTDENKSKVDYGPVLSDLIARRDLLNQAIASLEALALGSSEGMSFVKLAANVQNPGLHSGEVPSGAFLGKSIPEATKLYLSIVKRKQTTREISEALSKGGMETTSKNFEGIVGAGLNRAMNKAGEIVRVGRGWALAAWYPAGIRTVALQEKGKSAKIKNKKSQKRPRRANKSPSSSTGAQNQSSVPQRVLEHVNSHPTIVLTPREVAKALNIDGRGAAITLTRLTSLKKIERVEAGKYRALRGAAS